MEHKKKYLICSLSSPEMVVMALNTNGGATLTNNEKYAMLFDTKEEAEECIIVFLGNDGNFFGTRPAKPKAL